MIQPELRCFRYQHLKDLREEELLSNPAFSSITEPVVDLNSAHSSVNIRSSIWKG